MFFDRFPFRSLQKSENLREKPALQKVIPKMSTLR